MSTYFYVVCDKHKQSCDAASMGMGGIGALGHSFMLGRFCVDHCDCDIRVTNEHEDSIMSYEQPHENKPDPKDEARAEHAKLLARAQDAEARVRQLEKLYGVGKP